MTTYMGVILAAGKGSRMEYFSEDYPKTILPIGNIKLMEYHIREMVKVGIRKIIIVIGHLGFKIVDAIGNGERFGVKITYVDQGQTLGIAHALGKLEKFVDAPFLLFLGDIFFVTEAGLAPLIKVKEQKGVNAVLASKPENDREALKRNFAIVLKKGSKDVVAKVIEKPRYVVNNIKGCGLYLFDQHIFDAIRRTPRTAMRDEYEITDSIQILIQDGFTVKHLSIVREDMNLTVPADIIRCNVQILAEKKLKNMIGVGCRIHTKAEIINSVVGNNVTISSPLKLVDSVVFDSVSLDMTGEIVQSVVTPEKIYNAQQYE